MEHRGNFYECTFLNSLILFFYSSYTINYKFYYLISHITYWIFVYMSLNTFLNECTDLKKKLNGY